MPLKILTVDDSRTVRTIVRRAFAPFACEIAEAENGVEGLIMAAGKPDLILLDVTMPIMDGIEMLRKLRADAATAQIPVIMLTAEGQRTVAHEAGQLGSCGYISKPFTKDVLIQRVSALAPLRPASVESEAPV